MDETTGLWILVIISGLMIPTIVFVLIRRRGGSIRAMMKKGKGVFSKREKKDTVLAAVLTGVTLVFLYAIVFLIRSTNATGSVLLEGVVGALSVLMVAWTIAFGPKAI